MTDKKNGNTPNITEKKTDNEIIAEFMDAEQIHVGEWCHKYIFKDTNGVSHGYLIVDLKYATSFDWLMPVVEKIRKLPNKEIRFKLENSRARIWYGNKAFSCHTISALNSTYRVVVEFLHWYNSNK